MEGCAAWLAPFAQASVPEGGWKVLNSPTQKVDSVSAVLCLCQRQEIFFDNVFCISIISAMGFFIGCRSRNPAAGSSKFGPFHPR